MMRAKKLENLQICLTFLKEQLQLTVDGVEAEGETRPSHYNDSVLELHVCTDVLAGNLESILTICNGLRTHFAQLPVDNAKLPRPLVFATTVGKEDMRVFTWVGRHVGREITSYSEYVPSRAGKITP